MSEQARTVGSISQRYLILQIIVFALIISALYLFLPLPVQGVTFLPLLIGAGLYLIWSRLAQVVFLRHHRTGITFLRAGAYPQAIQSFEQSYALFAQRPWLDQSRWITLLSPASISYREMALNNLGYAQLQLGKHTNARATFQKLLETFPQGVMAETARQIIARIDSQNGRYRG
jgi:tetratricopeptide (TPR) repeat protein